MEQLAYLCRIKLFCDIFLLTKDVLVVTLCNIGLRKSLIDIEKKQEKYGTDK